MSIPKGQFPYVAHYVHFNQIYSFKDKEQTVDIRTVSPETSSSTPLAPACLQDPAIPEAARAKPKKAIRWLLNNGFIPSLKDREVTFVPQCLETPPPMTLEDTAAICSWTIEQLRELVVDIDAPDELTCSIENTLLKEPVVDKCGHAFEKSRIEEWLKTHNNLCPVSKQKIELNELNRSLNIESSVDKFRREYQPVPIPATKGVNDQMGATLIALGKECARSALTDADCSKALDLFTMGIPSSNRSEDYAPIPELFVRQKKEKHAALAYLYLGKCFLGENNVAAAKEAFKEAHRLAKSPLTEVLAQHDSRNPEIYDTLISRMGREKLTSHLCLVAYLHLFPTHPEVAFRFYYQARIADPAFMLAPLARLSRAEKDNTMLQVKLHCEIAGVYCQRQNAFTQLHLKNLKILL